MSEGFHLRNRAVDVVLDVTRWRDRNGMMSDFSVKIAWKDIRPRAVEVLWFRIVWFSHYVPRHAFHLWLVMRKSLQTQDKLRQWDVDLALCSSVSWYRPGPPRLQDIVVSLHPMAHKRTEISVIGRLLFAATSYYICIERNNRLFKNIIRSLEDMISSWLQSV
ncbi:kinase-like domain, phloem protein 2-like protein [Tanacetum coccineum]